VFTSILYGEYADVYGDEHRETPGYFSDLNLDQIVAAITAGKEEYDLAPFFNTPLKNCEAIRYRHEVMQDLEDDRVFASVAAFANNIRLMRGQLAQANKCYYQYQKERWFLHAAETYCAAVQEFNNTLSRLPIVSAGLRALRAYMMYYVTSHRFTGLNTASRELASELASVQYSVLVKGNWFKVRRYDFEDDYSVDVTATFEKFRQGAVKDYRAKFAASVEMNHIEAKVLEFVALLFPEQFSSLDDFFGSNRGFADSVLLRFDREIQFYVAYLDYLRRFKEVGLKFSYPVVSPTDKAVHDEDTFDLALATKLVATNAEIVSNDLDLSGPERIGLVSGPNQGGKTTFARTFGQLHHLASIGCPVPGSNARLFLFDSMFAHFEREENIETLRGKLQDDLVRIHDILEKATPRSVVIVNEIFTSTTLTDATFLAQKILEKIIELDLLCVCVTFLDDLASLSPKIASLVSSVAPENPTLRTFKVVRRPADGRSYALSIAEKYGLTYERLETRIPC
jgi:hypothetical protein